VDWTLLALPRTLQWSAARYLGGFKPSVDTDGDSYDNALAETINGLYKSEVIHRKGLWRSFEAVEFPTPEWDRLVQQSPAPGALRQHPAS